MPATKPRISLPARYRVIGHVANGGMASVWAAEDELLSRTVAVKILSAGFAADPSASKRFQREAKAAARVSVHPNVVTIYDIGEHEGHPFIVMEYLPGGTIAERLKGRRAIPRDLALRWLAQAAAALDAAHAAGIVHRDVKPANLLLDKDDRLAVADFGIATLAAEASLTQTGDVLGTAAYLSPEQALGRTATSASDRYSLAVVAYELLTGRRPFAADTPAAQLVQHVDAQPPRPSQLRTDLPAGVDAALARGMAKDPADRPKTARELVAGIERALNAPTDATAATRVLGAAITAPTKAVEAMTAPLRAAATAKVAPATSATAAPLPVGTVPPAVRKRGPRVRGRRGALVAAVLALAILGAALAGGLNGSRQNGGSPGTTTQSQAPPATPNKANTEGYRKLQSGDAAGAVPLLMQAVQGFRDAGVTDSPYYAYALYNLSAALMQTGRASDAIPYLQELLDLKPPNIPRKDIKDKLKFAQGGPQPGNGDGKHKGGDEGDEGD
jgi:serine/threonine-protein kinase